ncbi:MAG: ATP-binding protein [Aristaeellaceae bacterium]
MKRLKIRTRMTLWFVLSMVLMTATLFLVLDSIVQAELMRGLREDLSLAVAQIGAQVEHEQGDLVYEDETPIASNISYFVMEGNGSELFSHGEDIAQFDSLAIQEGAFSQLTLSDELWLVLDSEPIAVHEETVRIRVAASCEGIRTTQQAMQRVMTILFPLIALLSLLIGYLMMGRCLRPIRNMIAGAQRITAGHFHERLPAAPARDELGQLTETLNEMLGELDAAFQREQRFTSDASHELRTPVAVIQACAEELCTHDELSAEVEKPLHSIRNECCRMQRLIEQMLMLTRAQEGRLHLTIEPLCVLDVLESVQDALADLAADSDIQIAVHAPAELTVMADQSLLSQLILNLTENAIKYGKPHGHVELSAKGTPEGILILVRDDGSGIADKDLPHIFERFYRADTARDRSGTGLGLSIAQWIVQAHGGTISASSTATEGTTFSTFWPDQFRRSTSFACSRHKQTDAQKVHR